MRRIVLTIAREILSLPTASFRERRVRDYVKAFGYSCGAACVPLGNCHNRDFRRKKIAAEYVSVLDLVNRVRLFVAMVERSTDLPRFLRPSASDRPKYTEGAPRIRRAPLLLTPEPRAEACARLSGPGWMCVTLTSLFRSQLDLPTGPRKSDTGTMDVSPLFHVV